MYEIAFLLEAQEGVVAKKRRESIRILLAQHVLLKLFVITGASAGVGRATAQAFARKGARIGLIARGLDGLEATKREVEALGGRALILPADVALPEEVDQAAERVERRWRQKHR